METMEHQPTDKSENKSSGNFKSGAITGSILTFIGFTILSINMTLGWQVLDLLFELPIGLIAGIIIGAPAGGLGGVILGLIWKSDKAGIVGGLLGGIIIPPLIILLIILLVGF